MNKQPSGKSSPGAVQYDRSREPDSDAVAPDGVSSLQTWLDLSPEERVARWRAETLAGGWLASTADRRPIPPADEDLRELFSIFAMKTEEVPTVLSDRYKLIRPVWQDDACETWTALDQDGVEHLAKCWPYTDESLAGPARALWNTELRMLYRLGSSQNAQRSLLILRDAGVDRERQMYVMILFSEGLGYQRLVDALAVRSAHDWLSPRSLRTASTRAKLWDAFGTLAEGIESLHAQGVIHRCVCAEQVYFDPQGGSESMRLGGFEWSIRLGFNARPGGTSVQWSIPPEIAAFRHGFSFDSDWYAFGMLVVRCFFELEHLGDTSPEMRNREALRIVGDNSGGLLSDLEKDLLLRLIAVEPEDRLLRGREILLRIQRIRRQIVSGTATRSHLPLVLTFDPKNSKLVNAAKDSGFIPNPILPEEVYSPINRDHVAGLKDFLRDKLRDGRLYPGPDDARFVLAGRPGVTVVISAHRDRLGDGTASWEAAFILYPGELRTTKPELCRDDLQGVPLVVVESGEFAKYRGRQSWEAYLPIETAADHRGDLGTFHDFLRCTNMLELLMSCAEIFEYHVVDRFQNSIEETLIVEELPRRRIFPSFCKPENGLVGLLQRETESGKPGCRKVLLTHQENLHLVGIEEVDFWEITLVETATMRISLTRQRSSVREGIFAPDTGFIRTFGLNGQVRLINRRKRAIDRLSQHFYLLSALAQPGMVSMDTGSPTGLFQLPKDKVDESKRAVIEDIERVRPIYALQGPPGTGKTTLVAWKLRRLFEEDPLAQVLVTAQAHGAVDVLRRKVRSEAFHDVPEEKLPIAIRLGARQDAAEPRDSDTVDEVAKRLLEKARDRLQALPARTEIQDRWLAILHEKLLATTPREADGFFQDFYQLVKLSAGITYCTTSASDLADLASGSQLFNWSFDWTIVEEAGKVHGFDLALPLQTGHRWLLLGDHKQLPPFRLDNFQDALADLDAAVRALADLPDRTFLDHEWLERWRSWSENGSRQECQRFVQFSQSWLETFGRLFHSLIRLRAEDRLTTDVSIGAQAGKLSRQWRMHPLIGDLISKVFYEGGILNGTCDAQGLPRPEFNHRLRLRGIAGSDAIEGKAIVWIDLPWCGDDPRTIESGPLEGKPRYTNVREAVAVERFLERLEIVEAQDKDHEIAVLSPYTQQVLLLNGRLGRVEPKAGFRRVVSIGRAGSSDRWAHTVDSFQGNQADVIIVSLVRNNRRDDPDALGFLDSASRINVLLSRAEKLLVLVGSWKYFERQVATVRLDDTSNRLWFWKKTLTLLEEAFQSGRAVRLQANTVIARQPPPAP